jgi:hypothetical protein
MKLYIINNTYYYCLYDITPSGGARCGLMMIYILGIFRKVFDAQF